MNRIRTLKPEIHGHRKTGPLSHLHFRLFVGVITAADDEGRFVADAEQLRVLIFGYHRIRAAELEAGLKHLETLGLVKLYTAAGTPYGWLPSWHDHQRINRPTPSKLPPPPTEASVSTHGAISEDSVSPHGALTEASRLARARGIGSGSEGNGREGNGSAPHAPEGASPLAWLDRLNQEAGKQFKATDSNLRPIRARIAEVFTLEQDQLVVKSKVYDWTGTVFAKYLSPVSLFGT
jgi:uncharacterized phage protein (TIGR02220 family)